VFTPSLSNEIKRSALEAGFDLAGIAPATDAPEHALFPHWIANGTAGDMKYLEARNDAGELKRTSLKNAAPWARSVVVCALNYNTDQPYSTHAGRTTEGWISRYAWSQRDYHDVLLAKLRRLEASVVELCAQNGMEAPRTWCYVDTGPVIERIFAKYAGIGWIGKNTCILNQNLGSWLFLGVILMSVDLAPDLPPVDRCGSCTRCLDACPTAAFPAPYKLDATRCISYLTIEKRGTIPDEFRDGIGRQIFGCDICQDVCPWNRKAPITKTPDLEARPNLVNPDLARLARLSLDEFRQEFRGSPIKRAKHAGLLRNVAIAMGNSGEDRFVTALEELLQHDDAAVRDAAEWALRKLRN
jgi:epoxyqueuosine reductase